MAERIAAPIGAQSLLGLGIQSDFETPAVATDLVEFRSGGLDGATAMLFSQANLDTPAERTGKAVRGNFSGSGDFVIEITPKRSFPRLLTALLGAPTETILSPNTPAATTSSTSVIAPSAGNVFFFVVARNAAGYPSLPSLAAGPYADISQTITITTVAGAISYEILRGLTNSASAALKVGTITVGTTLVVAATGVTPGSAYTVSSAPVSEKVWKHTWAYKMLTMSQVKGQAVFAFPSVKVHGFNVRIDRTDSSVVTASVKAKPANMGALCGPKASNAQKATAMSKAGLDTALYDSSLPFSPSLVVTKIADVGGTLIASTIARGYSIDFDRRSADEYTLNGKYGPFAFTDGITGLSTSLTAYFKGEAQEHLARFMGQASDVGSGAEFGFVSDIKLVSVETMMSYPSGAGYNNSLAFVTPRCAYGAVGQPVGGRGDTIMQDIRIEPIFDGTIGTDLMIKLISAESAASISAASGSTFTMPTNEVQ